MKKAVKEHPMGISNILKIKRISSKKLKGNEFIQ